MYTCSNCSKEFEKVGPRNLHQYHCTLRSGMGEGAGVGAVKRKLAPPVTEQCQHEWRLLWNGLEERIARDNGYTKVCTKCEDVE